jgi:regulator of protease activity HflC (stomatin/prohibitin superfamily)
MQIITIIIGVVIFFVVFIRQIEEYQRGVMFTLGKFSGIKKAG